MRAAASYELRASCGDFLAMENQKPRVCRKQNVAQAVACELKPSGSGLARGSWLAARNSMECTNEM